jgi:hypothetical protein
MVTLTLRDIGIVALLMALVPVTGHQVPEDSTSAGAMRNADGTLCRAKCEAPSA